MLCLPIISKGEKMILLKIIIIIFLWYVGLVPSSMCIMATVMGLSDAPGKRTRKEIMLGIGVLSLIPIYYIGVFIIILFCV